MADENFKENNDDLDYEPGEKECVNNGIKTKQLDNNQATEESTVTSSATLDKTANKTTTDIIEAEEGILWKGATIGAGLGIGLNLYIGYLESQGTHLILWKTQTGTLLSTVQFLQTLPSLKANIVIASIVIASSSIIGSGASLRWMAEDVLNNLSR